MIDLTDSSSSADEVIDEVNEEVIDWLASILSICFLIPRLFSEVLLMLSYLRNSFRWSFLKELLFSLCMDCPDFFELSDTPSTVPIMISFYPLPFLYVLWFTFSNFLLSIEGLLVGVSEIAASC